MRVLDATGNVKQALSSTITPRSYDSFRHIGGSALEIWYCANCENATAFTAAATTANVLRALPFIAPARGGTLDRLGFNVTTLLAGNTRIGLYNSISDSNIYPNALLADSGSISTSTTGAKTFTVNVNLTAGNLYWLVLNSDVAVTLRSLNVSNIGPILGHSNTLTGVPNCGLTLGVTYAAFTSTFPGSATMITAAPIPALYYRFSA